jgi:hypothetical protein
VLLLLPPLLLLLQYATRACLAAAGLPSPRNARISIAADVTAAAETVGFPAVIKPVSGEFVCNKPQHQSSCTACF